MTHLDAVAHARQEAARQSNGRFGEQHRSAPAALTRVEATAAEQRFFDLITEVGDDNVALLRLREEVPGTLATILEDEGIDHITLAETDDDEFAVYVSEVEGRPAHAHTGLDERVSRVINAVVRDFDDVEELGGIELWEHEGTWTFEPADGRAAQRKLSGRGDTVQSGEAGP